MNPRLGVFALAALCSACTGLTVKPVSSSEDDSSADGFRYFEAAPYLLVYADGQGGITVSQLLYLPDPSRKRSVMPYAFLAKNETTLTFAGGVLTSSVSTTDATSLPKGLIEGAKKVAAAAMAGAFQLAEGQEPPPPGVVVPSPSLFKLVIDGPRTRLITATYPEGAPLELRVDVPTGGDL